MALRKVLIVGGGSAGWITAAYMDAVLNGSTKKIIDITVLESPDIGRIGVGEATVPSVRDTMRTIGVPEQDFMRAADATFKQAIKFVNWLDGNDSYYHPFDRRPAGRLDRAGLRWLSSDRSTPFAATVSPQPWMCEDGFGPKLMDSPDYEAPVSYAYHMDAERTADFLCDLATKRGVNHVQDLMVEAEMHEDGRIAAVKTQTGKRLEADLFIDCTGFRALLIEGALGVPHVDYSQWLLCDRAVAMRVPFETYYPGTRKPYTLSTAVSNGWIWDIGLANRRGVGYVYSSAFIDDDAAEAELRAYEGGHADDVQARTLKFKVGRREQFWAKNCVSIGLASGFIEPLESTGLFLVELAAATICEYFPMTDNMSGLANKFNLVMQRRYEETLDFIVLHYCLTRRNDTDFWREVQKSDRITDSLKSWLEIYQYKSPSHSDFTDSLQLFSHHTYEYVMYGMDFQRDKIAGRRMPPTPIPGEIEEAVLKAREAFPSHDAWLEAKFGTQYKRTGKP